MEDATARSRERVDEWLADFRERYGEFGRVEKHWSLGADAYDVHREWIEAGSNGGAGVWLARDDGAVLLVRDQDDDGWSDPGGKREEGESFEEAARREVREETNVECRILDLLEGHVLRVEHEADPARPTLWSLIAVFGGKYVSGDSRPREGEIADVGWFDETPAEVLYPEVAERPIPYDPE